jgi:hypothetical protein
MDAHTIARLGISNHNNFIAAHLSDTRIACCKNGSILQNYWIFIELFIKVVFESFLDRYENGMNFKFVDFSYTNTIISSTTVLLLINQGSQISAGLVRVGNSIF